MKTILTESTSKDWKAGMLFGGVLMFVGILLVSMSTLTAVGGICCFAGLVFHLGCRIGAWWNHG